MSAPSQHYSVPVYATRSRVWTGVFLAICLGILSACDTPQSILNPASSGAASITQLWWVMFWGTAVIMLITIGVALYAVFRPAHHRIPVSPLTVLVVGGLIWPGLVLSALFMYSVPRGHSLLTLPTAQEVLEVHVTGHQWWWEISYPDVEGSPVYTANELHIPAGRPVDIYVRGADVIHSFWIPSLGGKIDALPSSTNVIRLNPDETGEFRGQCAEFCGAQHARMALHVTAHTESDFNRQLQRLTRGPAVEDQDIRTPGQEAFESECARCHSVDPREPGSGAPNLATVADRQWLGAGTMENGEGAMLDWLKHHQLYKPGNHMPSHDQLDDETLQSIITFLEDIR